MKLRHWLLLISVPMLALTLLRHASSGSVPGSANISQASLPDARFVGAASCSASACHNNQSSPSVVGSEFNVWATRDPHAKAYESLFNETSLNIQKSRNSRIPSHEDPRCLRCHVSQQFDLPHPEHFKTDGVSCETCHGPAKQWLNVHHLGAWKRKSAAEKQTFGMRDLHSIVDRTQTCVPCHVGTPDAEVDHDLIAAGHPRLHFELSAFHAHLPRHWPDAKDRAGRPDFEARLWTVGQIATATASLQLLAHRADPKRPVWPEFAEHDCASCHHTLGDAVFQDFAKRKPGNLPWSNQAALVESALKSIDAKGDAELTDALAKLHAAFASGKPDRAVLTSNAQRAHARLTRWLNHFDRRTIQKNWLEILASDIDNQYVSIRGTDSAIDHLLATLAIRQARMNVGSLKDSSSGLADLQRISLKWHQTIPFEPVAIRERLRHIPR